MVFAICEGSESPFATLQCALKKFFEKMAGTLRDKEHLEHGGEERQ